MKIGILGNGNVGGALGASWARQGHEIMFGSARADTARQAAAFGEVIVLAVPWQVAHDLVPTLDLAGKIVIDVTNRPAGSEDALGQAASGAEVLAKLAPQAKVVKAFNITGSNNMENPAYAEGALAMFYCGDDAKSKETVALLVKQTGFAPCDLGPLANARLMEAQAQLWIWLAYKGGLGREFGFRLVKR